MQIRDIIFPLLFPAGYLLGLYLGKSLGQIKERRKSLLADLEKYSKHMNNYIAQIPPNSPQGMMIRGEPIKLTFDHEPSQEEIQQAINKITINGVPQMPINKDAAIKSEFESSDIYKTIKDLDNE